MHPNADSPLKVALVTARLNVGGPATHVISLASGLPADRFSVRLLAGREGRGEADMHYLAEGTAISPETVSGLSPHFGFGDLRALINLWRIFRKWQPDIVHTHTAKAGALGRVAARLAGVPVVVHTFHGHVLRGYFSPPAEAVFRTMERIFAGISDRILTLSPALKDDLVQMRIAPPEKIEVVPLGMDLGSFEKATRRRAELRAELGIPGDKPLIGIVGRLVPIKNHRLFLEAARSMVDSGTQAHFVIVGDGELRAGLESQANSVGLAARTHFLGWRRDMVQIYGGLDILSLTSDNEGTPVAVIEAMASGIPVVATAVGGVPDVVRDGITGWLVPAGDAKSLAGAWQAVLADRTARDRIRTAAQKEVIDRFSRRRMLLTISELYSRLARERNSDPVRKP